MNILGFPLQPGEALLAATVPIFILFLLSAVFPAIFLFTSVAMMIKYLEA